METGRFTGHTCYRIITYIFHGPGFGIRENFVVISMRPPTDLERQTVSSRNHMLKTWPEFFEQIAAGKKAFEVRRADREFLIADMLTLAEYEPTEQERLLFSRAKEES